LQNTFSRRKPYLFHFATDFWHFGDWRYLRLGRHSGYSVGLRASPGLAYDARKDILYVSVDPAQAGAFGLNVVQYIDDQVRFAAVDDNANTITIWKLNTANLTDPVR
jgi:hypothetical protein